MICIFEERYKWGIFLDYEVYVEKCYSSKIIWSYCIFLNIFIEKLICIAEDIAALILAIIWDSIKEDSSTLLSFIK